MSNKSSERLNNERKQKVMEHLSASTSSKLDASEITPPEWAGLPPKPMCDEKTYSRRMEHVARSLGSFYQKERTPAQIIEHLDLTAGN